MKLGRAVKRGVVWAIIWYFAALIIAIILIGWVYSQRAGPGDASVHLPAITTTTTTGGTS